MNAKGFICDPVFRHFVSFNPDRRIPKKAFVKKLDLTGGPYRKITRIVGWAIALTLIFAGSLTFGEILERGQLNAFEFVSLMPSVIAFVTGLLMIRKLGSIAQTPIHSLKNEKPGNFEMLGKAFASAIGFVFLLAGATGLIPPWNLYGRESSTYNLLASIGACGFGLTLLRLFLYRFGSTARAKIIIFRSLVSATVVLGLSMGLQKSPAQIKKHVSGKSEEIGAATDSTSIEISRTCASKVLMKDELDFFKDFVLIKRSAQIQILVKHFSMPDVLVERNFETLRKRIAGENIEQWLKWSTAEELGLNDEKPSHWLDKLENERDRALANFARQKTTFTKEEIEQANLIFRKSARVCTSSSQTSCASISRVDFFQVLRQCCVSGDCPEKTTETSI